MMKDTRGDHLRFVKALQHEPLWCRNAGCPGPVDAIDHSRQQMASAPLTPPVSNVAGIVDSAGRSH